MISGLTGLLRTPRPVPGRLVPLASGAVIILLALPIFAIAHLRLGAWALAAVLWVAGEAFGLALARLPLGSGNLAKAGVVAFGMMFRGIVIMVVLIAVALSNSRLAVTAAVLYALAYTFETGISMITYFGGDSTK